MGQKSHEDFHMPGMNFNPKISGGFRQGSESNFSANRINVCVCVWQKAKIYLTITKCTA